VTDLEFRHALRDWIVRTSGKVGKDELSDDMPIMERRIITSVQVMDLILFIEETTGNAVDVEQLKPGAFRDINEIVARFGGDRGR
jgi:acyl carrier protein